MDQLTLRGVSRWFGKRCVLSDVNYDFRAGRLYAVMGESGVGKSTLLKIMAALDNGYEGLVAWNGQEIRGWDNRQVSLFRKNTLGVQLQNDGLVPSLTACDNAALPLILGGKAVFDSRQEALRLMARLDIAGVADIKAAQLSGGEKKRVSLASALIRKPRLLLLDEPTGDLDAKHERIFLNVLLEEMEKRELCAVLVTHSREAAKKADHLLTLAAGEQGGILFERPRGTLEDP